METVSVATGSVGALMLPYRGRLPDVPHTQSLLGAFDAYVRDGWIHRDDRYLAIPTMLKNAWERSSTSQAQTLSSAGHSIRNFSRPSDCAGSPA